MTLRTRAGATLAAFLVATSAVALAASPAHAAKATYDDPADATASPTDMRTVQIDHSTTKLRVVVGFTDLRRRSTGRGAGIMIALDTDATRRGPEYRLTSGLQDGTDYQLLRVRRGHVVGEPLTCPHRVRLRFGQDRLVFRAARTCLGSPESVRIAVQMRDEQDRSHVVVDWLGAPRSFTDPVASS
jgi:hypothetical protein